MLNKMTIEDKELEVDTGFNETEKNNTIEQHQQKSQVLVWAQY